MAGWKGFILYSALEHVARSLWLSRYSEENFMAFMYSAYFDASGKKDSHRSITVAGAVSTVKKWLRFEREWSKVLREFGVKEFHYTDFAASLGEYKGWKGDKQRRSEFLRRLGPIIKANTNKFFMVTVEMEAWRSINEEYFLADVFQSPFALAGLSVIGLTRRWAEHKRIKSPIEFIFEDGDEDEDWIGLKKLCAGWAVIPTRLPKPKAIPCQVGDLLGWKTRIASQNTIRINKRIDPSRFDPQLLEEALAELRSLDSVIVRPADNKVYGPEALLRTCKKSGIKKRSSVHPTPDTLD
jgi:hypothetical protein